MSALHSRRRFLALISASASAFAGCSSITTTPAQSATEPLPGESDGWTHPAGTAAGTGYAPDAGHIRNEVAWSVRTDGALTTPVVIDGHLFVAAGFPTDQSDGDTFVDGGLLELDPVDGHERWRTVLPGMGGGFAGCPPTLSSGSLYVGHAGREFFYAVDARTGERRFSFETDNSVNNPIAAAEGNVVFTTSELVYALDETGTEQWSFGTDDETYLPGAAVVAEGVVFVGGATGDPSLGGYARQRRRTVVCRPRFPRRGGCT